MKKTIAIFLALCMCIGLCACGGNSATTEPTKSTEAQKADELILAIGEVTADSDEAIKTAQEYYNGLTDTQKAEVEYFDVLTKAQEVLPQKIAEAQHSNAVNLIADGDCIQASGIIAQYPEFSDYEDLMKQCGQGVLQQYIMENGEEKEAGKFFINLVNDDSTQISVWYFKDTNAIQLIRYDLSGYGDADAMMIDYVIGSDTMTYNRSTTKLGTPMNYQEGRVEVSEYTGKSNGSLAENSSTPLLIDGLTVTKVETAYEKQTRGYTQASMAYINEMLDVLFAAVMETGYKGTVSDIGFVAYKAE